VSREIAGNNSTPDVILEVRLDTAPPTNFNKQSFNGSVNLARLDYCYPWKTKSRLATFNHNPKMME
jgi:hypothetical protein